MNKGNKEERKEMKEQGYKSEGKIEKIGINSFIEITKIPNLTSQDVLIVKCPFDFLMQHSSELEEIALQIPCKLLVIDETLKLSLIKSGQLKENAIVIEGKDIGKITVVKQI